MLRKYIFIPLLAFIRVNATDLPTLDDLPCPPYDDAQFPILPGKCVTSYLCVEDGGNVTVKSSGAEAGVNCNSVIISLRCAGEHDTVEYNELAGIANVKCDHALISFSPEGLIEQKCCHTPDPIVEPVDDGGQQPLVDGNDGNTNGCPNGEPAIDNGNQEGTNPIDEGGQGSLCPGKNNSMPVAIDEQDPNYVWACRCNDGEVPERQAISGLQPNDNSGCPIIDLAIQKFDSSDFTIFCNKGLNDQSTQIRKIYNSTVRDCISQCSGDENCAAIWFDIRNCELYSSLETLAQPYLVAVANPAMRSVVAIKGNATNLATPTIQDPADSVVLANPTPIVGDIAGSPVNADDEYYQLELPFPIHIYDRSSSNVFVTVNGVLSLDSGSHSFSRTSLPTSNLPPYSVLGLWSDLYIYQGTPQGIYYEVTGEVGARTIVFEWYCSQFHQPTQYYHFTMAFYEGRPGAVTTKYYDVLDKGSQAVVGVQGGEQSVQFSIDQDIIVPGLEITFDTHKANRFTQTTFRV